MRAETGKSSPDDRATFAWRVVVIADDSNTFAMSPIRLKSSGGGKRKTGKEKEEASLAR